MTGGKGVSREGKGREKGVHDGHENAGDGNAGDGVCDG